jgi:hypothetical protein
VFIVTCGLDYEVSAEKASVKNNNERTMQAILV